VHCQGNWDIITHANLTQQAHVELLHLQNTLSSAQLQQGSDKAIWMRNATDLFSIKTAYQFITMSPHIQDNIYKL
jgi:hypothetical protein